MSVSTVVSGSESSSSTSCRHVATPSEKDWAPGRLAKPDGAAFVPGEISITAVEDDDGVIGDKVTRRPSVAVATPPSPVWTPNAASVASPATPAPRYPGWVSEVVAPLQDFIDEASDPRELYTDLQEIGEGSSGSVYAARVLASSPGEPPYVAIKNIPLLPSGVPKLEDLQRELTLMKGVRHPHILSMDAGYVDVVEDSLWLRMDLMERSLADVVVLVAEGIVVQEKPIAQFASDVLSALSFLQSLGIAHRDLRSDNLLVGRDGVVKIADFSSAVQVSRDQPMRTDPAGVIYWQPPEIRRGSYNALKVDVWSLGATVWEMAEAEPPFFGIEDPRQLADRWPPLRQPEIYSRSFHDFLHQCSQPNSLRPDPDTLSKMPFIRNANGRPAVIKLLSECRAVEERIARRQSTDSDGTVSLP
ncbi:kinase-like domain-containing protein [Sparassis latifolia]